MSNPITAGSDRKKSPVPAVEKALDVIELLSEQPDGLTMNEIVAALGRTMGELYRLVVYLTERGYLKQDPQTSRYSLTLRLFELSHRFDPTERMLRKALPLMEVYASRTQQSCHLGVLNQQNVLILASVASPRPAGYAVRTGAIFPVEQTATGAVVLAFSGAADQDRYLALLPKANQSTARARMDRIRQTGFEDGPSILVTGVRNLCAPVFDSQGIAAALTSGYISQPDQPVAPQAALSEIRSAALDLSRALGFSPETAGLADVLIP